RVAGALERRAMAGALERRAMAGALERRAVAGALGASSLVVLWFCSRNLLARAGAHVRFRSKGGPGPPDPDVPRGGTRALNVMTPDLGEGSPRLHRARCGRSRHALREPPER